MNNLGDLQIGYCCNVHPGTTLQQVLANLKTYSLKVKSLVSPDTPLPIGLWLSETVVRELDVVENVTALREFLIEQGLLAFTFNGFPFGDFHQEVVKQSVYEPVWGNPQRLEYTLRLAEIQHQLLPVDAVATISTLPIGWPQSGSNKSTLSENRAALVAGAAALKILARRLAELESKTGRRTIVCIEPEPGCLIDNARDLAAFFADHVLNGNSDQNRGMLRHLAVCHDICHSAVMFESQSEALDTYRSAGIQIGKVQVSSAIDIDFDRLDSGGRMDTLDMLRRFAEPKYLHQTTIQQGRVRRFFNDLPLALSSVADQPSGHWRVHFHVPIFARKLELISTSQNDIAEFMNHVRKSDLAVSHFEIETYAWNAIPPNLRHDNLAEDIAREIRWFRDLAEQQAAV